MAEIRVAFADLADLPGWKKDLSAQSPSRFTVQVSEESPDYTILKWLRRLHKVTIDGQNPDYVVFSVFGDNVLRFPNAVRIFFTGENIQPDFNICDYAFGSSWMTFGDRYCRCPFFMLMNQFDEIRQRRRTNPLEVNVGEKDRFCNFIYSNADADPFRDEIFAALNQYQKVDSVGSHLNNCESRLGPAYHGDWGSEKVRFQKRYRFTVAFENSSTPGYTTEKIVHALAADTIPIYWGNSEIGRDFNTRRFVNCHEFPNADAVVERVRQIDQNAGLFSKILAEPFFPDNNIPRSLQDETVLAQFEHIFSQSKSDAFRRSRFASGRKYEQRRIRQARAFALLEGRGIVSKFLRLYSRIFQRS
jgi:hypothetical protein